MTTSLRSPIRNTGLILACATLSGSAALAQLPSGFQNEVVVSGLEFGMQLAFLPDGRVLILEKGGTIHQLQPGASTVDPVAYLQLTDIEAEDERGLTSIALAPDYDTTGHFYLYYPKASTARYRISRFTEVGGLGDQGSEFLVWEDNNPWSSCCHYGGGMGFGPDGNLYLTTGEEFDATQAQDLLRSGGKIIRITPTGEIPPDNPFVDGPGGNVDSIWAIGLRNPFRASWDLPTGRFLIGEVGGNDNSTSTEDIHVAHVHEEGFLDHEDPLNFGWPLCEGMCVDPAFSDPVFSYPHAGSGASVTGGVVYRGIQYPTEYQGRYFYGDYVRGWIRMLTFDEGGTVVASQDFEPNAGAVVSIQEGLDGSIWYVEFSTTRGSRVHRITFQGGNLAPRITQATANPTSGPGPQLSVQFAGAATDDENDPISYSWSFGDGTTSTAQNPLHTYTARGVYEARLRASDFAHTTTSDPITIEVGEPPQVSIDAPVDGSDFRAGDTIAFSGSATDPDGPLSAANYSWRVLFHHNEHTHPGPGPFPGTTFGQFVVPTTAHDFSGDTGYEILLDVTDADGITRRDSVSIQPEKVLLTFDTVPSGLGVVVDDIPRSTPFVLDSAVGYQHTVGTTGPHCESFTQYEFLGWSDGGAETHVLTVPESDLAVTATYAAVGECALRAPGELVLYRFDEGGGVTVADSSGVGPAVDLTVQDPSAVTWLPDGGLSVDAATAIRSAGAAQKVIAAIQSTEALTIEAWVRPANTVQSGPARIVALTIDPFPNGGNFVLGQESFGGVDIAAYDVRLRSTTTNKYGIPSLHTAQGTLTPDLTHVVFTRSPTGTTRIYLNGVAAALGATGGQFINWNLTTPLSLANEAVGGRPWLGELHLVALYDRALTLEEVDLNFQAGAHPGGGAITDCNGNGVPDAVDISSGASQDCNSNGVPDSCDIASGTSTDLNGNGVPDDCETDCNGNGVPDDVDVASGSSQDCNGDGIPDECQPDCDADGLPDVCEADCTGNGIPDECEGLPDCNGNGVPDSCDIASGTSADSDGDGIPDECADDCNGNGVPDEDDIAAGTSQDCDGNGTPDECDPDCDGDGIPDACEIDCNANGIPDQCEAITDCDANGVPDECQPDCDGDGTPDACELDCDGNGVPDECDSFPDCDANGVPDACQPDCDGDGTPDACEVDCDGNGVPDECEPLVDCNGNGVPDACDIAGGASNDANGNGVPDECEADCNGNGVPDDLDVSSGASRDCNANGIPDECEGLPGCLRAAGEVALYRFEEGSGATVHDLSGIAPALELTIADPGSVTWLPNGGLVVGAPTGVVSGGPATKLLQALAASQAFSVEAWVRPANTTQSGPARIVALSVDPNQRGANLVLGQESFASSDVASYDVRSRSTTSDKFGRPSIRTPQGVLTTELKHVVMTRSATGARRIYVDGLLQASDTPGGTLGNWLTNAELALANEPTLNRPWLGELHLVAFYDRALTPEEVEQNRAAGPHPSTGIVDCNANGVPDDEDVASGTSTDCDGNGVPDECQPDCDADGIPDACEPDCDLDGVPDECEVDCDADGLPDECQAFEDCNGNGIPDACDIASGTSTDANGNDVPDECEDDCNGNGIPDDEDISSGTSSDCDGNGVPDECQADCDADGTPDACEPDCDSDGVPDDCELDCDADGVPDECQTFEDCNGNGVPDVCDIASGSSTDLDANDIPDECDVDCNGNGIPDDLDLSSGASQDCDANGVPDECQPDCDADGIPDVCETDCDANGVPDDCEGHADCNANGIPDACESGVECLRATGEVVLYTFQEGAGATVHDVSSGGPALDLTLQNPAAATWLSGGGLSLDAATGLLSSGPATDLITRLQASQALTIEAWVKPANTTQSGPARIVALSVNPGTVGANFVLGQESFAMVDVAAYDVRLRSTQSDKYGRPSIRSAQGTLTTELKHVVFTRSTSGEKRLYVDGVLWASATAPGSFSNWLQDARLCLGNEPTLDRAWLGELHLVAVYDRALTVEEIEQNLTAGPDIGG